VQQRADHLRAHPLDYAVACRADSGPLSAAALRARPASAGRRGPLPGRRLRRRPISMLAVQLG